MNVSSCRCSVPDFGKLTESQDQQNAEIQTLHECRFLLRPARIVIPNVRIPRHLGLVFSHSAIRRGVSRELILRNPVGLDRDSLLVGYCSNMSFAKVRHPEESTAKEAGCRDEVQLR